MAINCPKGLRFTAAFVVAGFFYKNGLVHIKIFYKLDYILKHFISSVGLLVPGKLADIDIL